MLVLQRSGSWLVSSANKEWSRLETAIIRTISTQRTQAAIVRITTKYEKPSKGTS